MTGERDCYDAASIVDQMAGLDAGHPKPPKVPPAQLVERFCASVEPGLVAMPSMEGYARVRSRPRLADSSAKTAA